MENNYYSITYTYTFNKEADNVLKYIGNELKNVIAAENLLRLIDKSINERRYNPESYHPVKLNNSGRYIWYKININNYTAFYTVKNNEMIMRRFIYSRRNFEKLF